MNRSTNGPMDQMNGLMNGLMNGPMDQMDGSGARRRLGELWNRAVRGAGRLMMRGSSRGGAQGGGDGEDEGKGGPLTSHVLIRHPSLVVCSKLLTNNV